MVRNFEKLGGRASHHLTIPALWPSPSVGLRPLLDQPQSFGAAVPLSPRSSCAPTSLSRPAHLFSARHDTSQRACLKRRERGVERRGGAIGRNLSTATSGDVVCRNRLDASARLSARFEMKPSPSLTKAGAEKPQRASKTTVGQSSGAVVAVRAATGNGMPWQRPHPTAGAFRGRP